MSKAKWKTPFLVLIRGVPGTGKTTLASTLSDEYEIPYFESDMFFTHPDTEERKHDSSRYKHSHTWCQMQAARSLYWGIPCIVSNTLIHAWHITYYLDLAFEYKAQVIITDMTTEYGSIHNVPESAMKDMRINFEPAKDMSMRGVKVLNPAALHAYIAKQADKRKVAA